MSRSKFEIHEHSYISGPNSRFAGLDRSRITHSHEFGDQPHEHADEVHRTGPGCYVIDSKSWAAATGMRGGGKKRYTRTPTGTQMPIIKVDPPQIRVIVVGDGGASVSRGAEGPGDAPIVRMILGMKAEVVSVQHDRSTRIAGVK